MIDLDDYLDGIVPAIESESKARNADSLEVFDGMTGDYMVDSKYALLDRLGQRQTAIEDEFHRPANLGMMRMNGLDEDEYAEAVSNPARLVKMKADYFMSI